MAEEKFEQCIDKFLEPTREGETGRRRKLTCLSTQRIPEVDVDTGSWPSPFADAVQRRKIGGLPTILLADTSAACGCGAHAWQYVCEERVPGRVPTRLFDVAGCCEVDVQSARWAAFCGCLSFTSGETLTPSCFAPVAFQVLYVRGCPPLRRGAGCHPLQGYHAPLHLGAAAALPGPVVRRRNHLHHFLVRSHMN